MKNGFLASALCLVSAGAVAADLPARAPAMAPAPVANSFDAFGSLSAGYNSWDFEGQSLDGLNLQGRASFAAPLSGALGFQADGTFERSKLSADQGNMINNTGSLAGHLFWRDSNAGLFGLIAQASSKNSSYISDRQYFIGVEGQYFLGNVTLYGQAAYQNLGVGMYGTSMDSDGFALAGQVRYFAAPNVMFALKGGYSTLSFDAYGSSFDLNAWTIGAKAEYRLAASPISLIAEADYRRGAYKGEGSSVSENDTRVTVGAKWNFGTQTLIQRDRSGASLDPFRSLAPPALMIDSQQ
ncbi:MAG: hypothetical protein JWN93_1699 [Hyphomicrobiales bacterium]|nr:hypothetical protein [Hyphomicrobiales bacterium]